MSDLSFITGEIYKILGESTKVAAAPSEVKQESDLPSLGETVDVVAGVVMEEFPEGGDSKLFGRALVEAAIGSSRDTGLDPDDIFEGLVEFFSEGIAAANGVKHLLYEEDLESEEYNEYEDEYEDEDDYVED